MAKKKNKNEEVIVDVQEVYSKTELFIEKHQKSIIGVVAAIAILVAGYFAYKSFYLKPLQVEAQQEMFMAEKYFAIDSMNLAINGDNNYPGFLEIIDNYGATKSGNLARYYLGIAYLRTGRYEAAISALKDFNKEDEFIGTIALGAIGDAFIELGDINQGIEYYEKASKRSPDEFTTPVYLKKAAQAYELLGEYDEALEKYEAIKKDYTNTPEASEIDKYIARAESLSR